MVVAQQNWIQPTIRPQLNAHNCNRATILVALGFSLHKNIRYLEDANQVVTRVWPRQDSQQRTPVGHIIGTTGEAGVRVRRGIEEVSNNYSFCSYSIHSASPKRTTILPFQGPWHITLRHLHLLYFWWSRYFEKMPPRAVSKRKQTSNPSTWLTWNQARTKWR